MLLVFLGAESIRVAIVDTSVILLAFERGYDLFEGLIYDLDDSYSCVVSDSVLREIIAKKMSSSDRLYRFIDSVIIPRVLENCRVVAVAEDYEFEDADHDLVRLALSLNAPIATNDAELKSVARSLGVKTIYFRESKNRLEMG